MITKLRNLATRLRGMGFRPSQDYLWQRVTWPIQERRLGIRTTGVVRLSELGVPTSQHSDYAPISFGCLRRILKRIDIRAGKDVLIDYGSGLGRVVLVAATFPLQRVIGVELSEQLTRGALDNLANSKDRLKCKDVKFIVTDATQYELPDDVTIAFFFNPFRGGVLESVYQRLCDSLDRAPRRLTVVYVHPGEDAERLFKGEGPFVLREEYNDWYNPGSFGTIMIFNS
ncbi:MAG: class I SAM-dependent methyltransferase [Planctomycetes bacterium]|nr:class I SAM-dependent methyltransferase [Planctomycetota bacterium]